jgi:hypothetical protein
MDSPTMIDFIAKGIGAGVLKPNEGRALLNSKPVEGGDTPYLQQQNYSLAALNRRDQATPAPPSTPAPSNDDEPDDDEPTETDEPDDDEPDDVPGEAEDETRASETSTLRTLLLAKVTRLDYGA